jgi:hypothetical protein
MKGVGKDRLRLHYHRPGPRYQGLAIVLALRSCPRCSHPFHAVPNCSQRTPATGGMHESLGTGPFIYRRGTPWPALHLPSSHSSSAGQPTLLLPFSRLLFHGPAPILLPRLTQASTGPEPIFSIFTLPTPLTHHDHWSLQSRCALPRAPAFPRRHHSLGAGLPGTQHLPAHAGLSDLGWSDLW